MFRALIRFGLSRRPIILLALLVFGGAGYVAFTRLNIEAYPNPAPVILEITAQAPGISAEEMERYYTIPMEVGLAATPGVNVIRSTSFYGLSFVRVTFDYGVDYYFALTQANISLTQNVQLPNGVQPQIQGSSLVGEIFRYQLVGPPGFGLTNLRTVQDWIMQRRLLTVPGVIQVNTWGGTTKEYEVEADLNRLEAYGVTVPQLVQAVGNANANVGGRTVNIGQQSVNVRGVGLIDSGGNDDLTQGVRVEDIENIVLAQANGVPVTVKDVARVYVGFQPRLGKAGRDAEDDVVAAIVVMNRTLHTNDVVTRVQQEIEKINAEGVLPPGVRAVPFYDRSGLVAVTSHTVIHNLLFGCALVFLIQWVFLGDLRSAVIVGVNIPFALFFSILIMVLRGEDANLLSLGAVDFGIIVDSAVILVENVFRNFQTSPEEQLALLSRHAAEEFSGAEGTALDRLRLIFASALQVDSAVLFSTAITVAAFVPLFTMQGVEGQIFNPMARTYGYALAGALLATFTITPVIASYLLPKKVQEKETLVVRAIARVYEPLLGWTLRHRLAAVLAGLVFLGGVGLNATKLGSEFLPVLEEGNLWIRVNLPPTISLEAAMPTATRIREILVAHPEVITAVSQHGRPDNGSDAAGFYNIEYFVPLRPYDSWAAGRTKEDLIRDLQAEMAREFVGITLNFSQYIQDNIEEGLSGIKGANAVKIIGPDLQVLERLADRAQEELAQVRGVADLGIFRVLGQPNLNIRVDRAKAARYGLNAGDVNTVVQAALGGAVATTQLENERQFNVTVRAAPRFRDTLEEIARIRVAYTATGGGTGYVPLTELATISLDTGASYIYHERNARFIPVKFSVRGRDLGGTVAESMERLGRNLELPPGYRLEWAGEFEELQQAKARLEVIVPVSLALICVLLYGLFGNIRDSLLTLAGIPFSIAGGLLALEFAGLDFSISAAIGFVSLFGVSVMDGILMITYYNEAHAGGMSARDAMHHAARHRMRPMLMTALSACIGLLPAALSTGIGSQVQRPLATVVVGGMLLGPVMLLCVVPALRLMFLRDEPPPAPAPKTEPAHA